MLQIKRLFRSTLGYLGLGHKYSYSQFGEDLIIRELLYMIQVGHPLYLDIGANQPRWLSNTYLFYARGARGVCVEPDPTLYGTLRRARPHDVCLNFGVGDKDDEVLDFYVMSDSSVNTFSKEEAEKYVGFGVQKIKQVLQVPCLSMNTLIERYFKKTIDFVSIDVEGYDFQIIKSINFDIYRPKVFCIETMLFTPEEVPIKQHEMIEFMISKDYRVFADTFLNTIFVDQHVWNKRFDNLDHAKTT